MNTLNPQPDNRLKDVYIKQLEEKVKELIFQAEHRLNDEYLQAIEHRMQNFSAPEE